MCELPSNVFAIDEFAKVFDGFSVSSWLFSCFACVLSTASPMHAHTPPSAAVVPAKNRLDQMI